ncbi:gamma-glutamyltransferase family protein [Vibrio palustris]|uniref:Putative gamma-glutamyltransferase YwrD n=1 Tax=Vibrio palustris TaxID=1918946 RepID=A0A1R4B4J7_9VIBR|nr:gamma-glutamyltransferase family protein [Vibrio palustris]SJL83848.1 Putative gamma-glutamyltransferase YwrD [Vibrio palustris]
MTTKQTAFTAPHYLAAQTGQRILDAGGTACEAMVAAAAMVTVQYPHMSGLGGDGFWLISKPGEKPVAIDACGAAAEHATLSEYQTTYGMIPESGGGAALTMAGTVSGWNKALEYNHSGLSLATLLGDAIHAADAGIAVTDSLAYASHKTFARLQDEASFNQWYLKDNMPLSAGEKVTNSTLSKTLQQLAEHGLDDFYHGTLATLMAEDLQAVGSPLQLSDFQRYTANWCEPLTTSISKGELYNLGAPTQGLASLLILAIYDRLVDDNMVELDHIHRLVEATKQAFIIRDRVIADPQSLTCELQDYLTPEYIDELARSVDVNQAAPWPHIAKPGDTIWMGACDKDGTMVSFIQSLYWEFGSGVVLPQTGIVWNCRGKSFSLDPKHHNVLAPRKKPFHTLNPAYAELKDGQRMVYGTMGGEGQPQTQGCLFSRYCYQGETLQDAVAKPRWLLGRTWGAETDNLRLEKALYDSLGTSLHKMGHDVVSVPNNNEVMGHAGAIISCTNGTAQATSDPRSDGTYLLGDYHG